MSAIQQLGPEGAKPVPPLRPDLALIANDEGNGDVLEHDLDAARSYLDELDRTDPSRPA